MIKQYYKDDYVSIELEEEIPCIKATVQGVPRFSEHFQLVQVKRLELMHQSLKDFEVLHFLTDARLAGPVLNEDVEFFRTSVLPEIEDVGISCLAVVLPAGKITRYTIYEMLSAVTKLESKTFEDMREAKAWLRSKTLEFSVAKP